MAPGQKLTKRVDASNNTNLCLSSGSHVIPHPDKVQKGGEDAHLILPQALAVCDGVGGWASHGVDPALYARAFVDNLKEALRENAPGLHKPVVLLRQAYDATKVTGSSTACMLCVFPAEVEVEGEKKVVLMLEAANLGDSGFLVIRQEQLVYRSKPQCKGFNFPFQLGTHSNDTPERADTYSFQLEQGDYIVLASDGLFDNLFPKVIVDTVSKLSEQGKDAAAIASELARRASEVSRSRMQETPFSKEARAAHLSYAGGKPDDITVVVSTVVPSESLRPEP